MIYDKLQVNSDDERFMLEAIKQAEIAEEAGEVPVGAVVVQDGKIIAKAHNQVETDKASSFHAEMIALAEAEKALGEKWLLDATMYVTLEPCSMCAGAMVLARIKRLVIGAKDPKTGACGSKVNVINNEGLNHRVEVTTGVFEEACSEMLTSFFKEKRTSNI